MRVVYEAEHLLDAHLVRGALEVQGIRAWVNGEFLTGAMGQLPVSGLLSVMVSDLDWDAAQPVIEALNEARAASAIESDGDTAPDPGPPAPWPA
jgi:hypothetical protein